MTGFTPPATFQHVQESDEIAFDIRKRILHRVSNTRLRREVNDPFGAKSFKYQFGGTPVGDISALKLEALDRFKDFDPIFLQCNIIVRTEVIDTQDFRTFEQDAFCGVKADKSRDTSYQ